MSREKGVFLRKNKIEKSKKEKRNKKGRKTKGSSKMKK